MEAASALKLANKGNVRLCYIIERITQLKLRFKIDLDVVLLDIVKTPFEHILGAEVGAALMKHHTDNGVQVFDSASLIRLLLYQKFTRRPSLE